VTTPATVRAYACGHCGKPYPHTEAGKRFAEACCKCRECGGTGARYTGIGSYCGKCQARTALKNAREDVVRAQEFVAKAEAAARECGVWEPEKAGGKP
jgi:hypothetical protein